MVTQSRLKELLHYDPHSGVFTRLKSTSCNTLPGQVVGCKNKAGYLVIRLDTKLYYLHRLAHLYMVGEWPAQQIDHVNANKEDNSWENLEAVSDSYNKRNLRRREGSILTGVRWCEGRCKWEVQMKVGNKKIYLGRYADLFIACCVRKSAEIRYGFNTNHGVMV